MTQIIKGSTFYFKHSALALLMAAMLAGCATTGATDDTDSLVAKPYAPDEDLIVHRDKAVALYKGGALDQALAIYDRLLLNVPEDAELWFRKGNIHARLDQPKQAVEAYEQALARNPRLYKAWRNMSSVQLRESANSLTQLMLILPTDHPLYGSSLAQAQEVLKLVGKQPEPRKVGEVIFNENDFLPPATAENQ